LNELVIYYSLGRGNIALKRFSQCSSGIIASLLAVVVYGDPGLGGLIGFILFPLNINRHAKTQTSGDKGRREYAI
jgi:hypothetical protein